MRGTLVAILLTLALGGCAQLRALEDPSPAPDPGESMRAYMLRLGGAEPAELERIGRTFEAPINAASRPQQALRRALWQATPGHTGHDGAAAGRALRALLDRPGALAQDQRELTRLYLAWLDRYAQLRRANADLAATNRELRQKIEALTNLEREMGGDVNDGE